MKKNLGILLMAIVIVNYESYANRNEERQLEQKLYRAAEMGDIYTIKKIKFPDDYVLQKTFIIACQSGCESLAKYLLKQGANVNRLIDIRPLHGAAESGNAKLVDYLVQAGADVNLLNKHDSIPPLISALYEGHNDLAIKLLDYGTDINLKNYMGDSLLMRVITAGDLNGFDTTDVAIELIKRGADINFQGYGKVTALMLAAQEGNSQLVEFLVQNGANVNSLDNVRDMPAFMHALYKGHLKLAIKLIGYGTNINLQDSFGNSLLMRVIYDANRNGFDWNDMAIELISSGADINAKANDNVTALMLAAFASNNMLADALLKCGADVNVAAGDVINWEIRKGDTALILAAGSGNINIITKLIEYGANIAANSESGSNALMRASMNGHAQMVSRLLELGLDKNAKDNAGYTALDYAIKYKRDSVVSVLQR